MVRGRYLIGVVAVVAATAGCERADSPGSPAAGPVTVPNALPGEPAIGADREAMLRSFATNISQGLYTSNNLLFLLCNSETGRSAANQSGDPLSMALMRRMVLLFRSAPGMATAVCAPPGSPQPGSPLPDPPRPPAP